jgi:hypothetical protein
MKIFLSIAEEGYELAHPAPPWTFEEIQSEIDGRRHPHWSPIRMRLIKHDEHGHHWAPADAPWFGSDVLVLKPRAAEAARAVVDRQAELLRAETDEGPLFLVNPLRVLDALDERASTVTRLSSSGRIIDIQKHVFLPEKVGDAIVFKITSLRVSRTYVCEPFVERWNAEGFKGLRFKEAWSG